MPKLKKPTHTNTVGESIGDVQGDHRDLVGEGGVQLQNDPGSGEDAFGLEQHQHL